MSMFDLMLTNQILIFIGKINTGWIFLDIIYGILISSFLLYFTSNEFKSSISEKISRLTSRTPSVNTIKFTSTNDKSSFKYIGIMWYLSTLNDPSIKTISEYLTDNYLGKITSITTYRIDQATKFYIDRQLGIEGCVFTWMEVKEDKNGKKPKSSDSKETWGLEIFSSKLSLGELDEWVCRIVKLYNEWTLTKSINGQKIIDIYWDNELDDTIINDYDWKSNVTFNNRFFTGKDTILEKIKFFMDNPGWYEARGIPYTMGFLLWGEPGCGKTGFIKSLMNLTKRHALNIKLSDCFDMNFLKDIICDSHIGRDLNIPPSNRIIILEDIDCMGSLVKKRTKSESGSDYESESESESESDLSLSKSSSKSKSKSSSKSKSIPIQMFQREMVKQITQMKTGLGQDSTCESSKQKPNTKSNNNLSFLLNILDGIQECPGRIVIMTTNKPEYLDPALIRPGRIDFNICFTKATISDIKNIINHYWNSGNSEISVDLISIEKIPLAADQYFSHAEIVNFCRGSNDLETTIGKIISNIKFD
jgi:hypothetical protein